MSQKFNHSIPTPPSFIHLRLHSSYSLAEGAIRINDMISYCQKHQSPAIAITDRANLFGALEFSVACLKAGIQPIIGAMLPLPAIVNNPPNKELTNHEDWSKDWLVLLVQNEIGWRNLLQLVSDAWLKPEGGEKNAPLISYDNLYRYSEGLIALTSGREGAINRLLVAGEHSAAKNKLSEFKEVFSDRLYIEIARHNNMVDELSVEKPLISLADELNLPIVATNDAYFTSNDMYEAHDALLCIAEGRYINEHDRRRLSADHYLKSPEEMLAIFPDLPDAIANSIAIAKRCAFNAPTLSPILPSFDTSEGRDENEEFRVRAREGLNFRIEHYVKPFYPDITDEQLQEYYTRLDYELDIICNMKFPGYFLIVSDFISWSKEHNIPVGPGRGSGAGSLVAWSLLITDLDPLRFGLLFERFLNPERVSMPDFDIDFCQERREETIRYVQEKYGRDRVAQIITFGKLQARAVLRDVGRVLQMPYGQVNKISKLVPHNPANPVDLQGALELEPMIRQAMKEDEAVAKMVEMSLKLEGLNRHCSTHAAGVVIADRPLEQLVALYNDAKSDMPVVQYSMKYAEMAGLVKFDFLGLKTLTVLDKACQMIKMQYDTDIDLLKLPEGDEKTYQMLGRGESIGVFQLESSGMRDVLRKMRPDAIEDIIALVSLYRPGPMDNIPTYIARKHGDEEPEYPHPLIESVLEETFGVIIYQEQVMQIAQLLAGYSLGAADLLRRAMGKKIKAEMDAQREIFVEGAAKHNDVPKAQAEYIFDLIAKFASYGFNKSHAAAYALISYQTAYIKANYPVEFFAASMTLDIHNTDKLIYFVQDARKFGVEIIPPDINSCDAVFSVSGNQLFYALGALKNVGLEAMKSLVAERKANGAFIDIYNFVERVESKVLNRRQMESLIKSGAFDSLYQNRRELLNNLELLLRHGQQFKEEQVAEQTSLFAIMSSGISSSASSGMSAGNAMQPTTEDRSNRPTLIPETAFSKIAQLNHECDAIGFYLMEHPLSSYQDVLDNLRTTNSKDFEHKLSEKPRDINVAGIVISRKIKASQKGRFAFLSVSDSGGMYEITIYDDELLDNAWNNVEVGNAIFVRAEGRSSEGSYRIIARAIEDLDNATTIKASKIHIEIDSNRYANLSDFRDKMLAPFAKIIGGIKVMKNNLPGSKILIDIAIHEKFNNDNNQSHIVTIELPGKYRFSHSVIDELSGIGLKVIV